MNYGCLWLPGSSPYLEAAECTPLPNPYFTQGTCGGFVCPTNRCESRCESTASEQGERRIKGRVNQLLGVPALGLMESFGFETSLEAYLRVSF